MNKRFLTLISCLLVSIMSKAVSITPVEMATLPTVLSEASGLDFDGSGRLWMHNDGYGDNHLYKVNNLGNINVTLAVTNAINYDWEDLAHDFNGNYMYIGDFGNNNCDRTNLHIYRIPHPKHVTASSVAADVIHFTYPDQTQFPSSWLNFDAEGFFHYNGMLYIFSKADGNAVGYTKLYTVPDQPGTYVATLLDSFYTNDRITSADINSDASAAIISTNSHIHIFTGWTGENIFSGNHVMITISGSWTQKESLAFKDINHVYMTDEDNGSGNHLYSIDLSQWIADNTTSIEGVAKSSQVSMTAFPNPANNNVSFQLKGMNASNASILLFDIAGNKVRDAKLNEASGSVFMETADLPSGVYFYRLFENDKAILTQRLVISH